MTSLKRRLTADDEERGLTLAELLVAMMVTAIVLAAVSGLFVSITKATTSVQLTNNSTQNASNIMEELTKVVRGGTSVASSTGTLNAFSVADVSTLTIYSYVDGDASNPAPAKVQFSINAAKQLVESRTAATSVGGYWAWTGAATTRNLGGAILGPASGVTAIFVYLDSNGAAIAAPVSSANLASIASVQISITVQGDPAAAAQTIQLTNTVGIPNVATVRSTS